MAEPTDNQLGRLLGRGRPGGPETDALWARVEASLDAGGTAPVTNLRARRWKTALVLAPLAAAAAALLLVPRQEPRSPQPRGPTDMAATVEASCGAGDAPCRVKERVRLRLHGGRAPTWVLLDLAAPDGTPHRLHGPVRVSSDQVLAVPVEVEPEPADVTTGITLRVTTVPVDTDTGAPDEDDVRLRGTPAHVLRLNVVAHGGAP